MKYYEQIVSHRHSCRGFDMRHVEDEKIDAVMDYYNEEESCLVDDILTELRLYDSSAFGTLSTSVGYNGICIKAPHYVVLFSENKEHYLENTT